MPKGDALTKTEVEKLRFLLEKRAPNTFDVVAEVFSIGMWNGMDFNHADLMSIANSFHVLKDNHSVPLKFGHNEDQPFTDGQPALGWVEDLFIEGDKLKAKFTDVPEVVAKAIKAGRYKKVSIELDMGVEHMGQHYPLVLSGVALLGADIPAVNNLADLEVLMSRSKGSVHGTRRTFFTAVKSQEGNQVDEKEAAKLRADNEALVAQAKKDADEKAKFTAENAKLKADAEVREKAEATAEAARKKATFAATLEEQVKAKTMTPATRETLMAGWIDDKPEASLEKLSFAVSAMGIDTKKVKVNEDSEGRVKGEDEDEGELPSDILLTRVNKMRAANPIMSFQAAKQSVFKGDKELAKKYVMENGSYDQGRNS